MQNPDRLIDKTHLSIDQAEKRGFIHRDYIAHCFRWSHVVKFLMQRHQYKGAHIMDVGCGKDQPLPRLLYSNKMTGFKYSGVDVNRLDPDDALVKAVKNGKIEAKLYEQTNFADLEMERIVFGKADYLVCFEVLEHVHPAICKRMILKIKEVLAHGGRAFISTPNFNGSAAGNHINEMHRMTLGYAFDFWGLRVIDCYGTFASQNDLHRKMTENVHNVWKQLSEYYDSNVLSTIFAPLYPEASRNNLWVLENTPTELAGDSELVSMALDYPNQSKDISELFEV